MCAHAVQNVHTTLMHQVAETTLGDRSPWKDHQAQFDTWDCSTVPKQKQKQNPRKTGNPENRVIRAVGAVGAGGAVGVVREVMRLAWRFGSLAWSRS